MALLHFQDHSVQTGIADNHGQLTTLLHALLCAMQLPLGGVYKEPGYFGSTTALGKSSPVTINATLPGTLLPLSPAICCSRHRQSIYKLPLDAAKLCFEWHVEPTRKQHASCPHSMLH